MEFYDLMRKRRMVRAFRPDPIPEDSLARILGAAQRAPSAGHSQGQRYIVIQDEERKAKIAANCNEQDYVSVGFDHFISGAPTLIIPCTNEQIYRRRYREKDKLLPDGSEFVWPVPYWYMDIGCSVMMILLAVVEEGLAAGFACFGDNQALRELLGIPEEVEPMGAIPIGYAAPDKLTPSLKRGRSKNVVRYEGW